MTGTSRGTVEPTARLFFVLGLLVVLLQRLAVPVAGHQIPLTSVAVLAILAAAAAAGRVMIDPVRLVVYCGFAACGGAVLIGTHGSVSAFALLMTLWLPIVISVSNAGEAQRAFLRGLVVAVLAASPLALLQSAVSALTATFVDPVRALPAGFLLQGYNTTDPITYGSTWMKSNGMVFLEPSFLSLTSVLAMVVVYCEGFRRPLTHRQELAVLFWLALTVFSSVAASGLVLLPALGLALLFRRGKRGMALIASVGAALLVLWQTPLWDSVAARLFTTDLNTGSNAARLIRGYTDVLSVWVSSGPPFGFGPGTAHELALATYIDWRNEVTTPTVVKALYEYGLVGAAGLLALGLALVVHSRLALATTVAVGLAFVVPTDGLTSSFLVALVCFTSLPEHGSRPEPQPIATRRRGEIVGAPGGRPSPSPANPRSDARRPVVPTPRAGDLDGA